jgi:myosin heavy subunit
MGSERDNRKGDVEALRSRMDADARFHRVLHGYDPDEVRECLDEMKMASVQQSKAAKQEQEGLIDQLASAKSEIEARNCAMNTLKETMAQKEAELNEASAKISTLVANIKKYEAERQGYERLRGAVDGVRAANERIQTLEQEVQQLRGALSKAASVGETWKNERAHLVDENTRMREEISRLRAESTRLAAERDEARNYAYKATVESRAESDRTQANEKSYTQQRQQEVIARQEPQETYTRQEPPKQTGIPPQIADRLADTFAEAYALINQLRNGEDTDNDSPPGSHPHMQVLRPTNDRGRR